jgi:hypothetical protein
VQQQGQAAYLPLSVLEGFANRAPTSDFFAGL